MTRVKQFDLEDRTLNFSKKIILLCKKLPRETVNFVIIDQLIRAAASIGANYREANDALGKKDFVMRVKIARKEAKETLYWLELLKEANQKFLEEVKDLEKECEELKKILSSIINKFYSLN